MSPSAGPVRSRICKQATECFIAKFQQCTCCQMYLFHKVLASGRVHDPVTLSLATSLTYRPLLHSSYYLFGLMYCAVVSFCGVFQSQQKGKQKKRNSHRNNLETYFCERESDGNTYEPKSRAYKFRLIFFL